MISNKKHAQQLAALLLSKGVSHIVISPGSRNAPLINTFTGTPGFSCLNIVDERSAAFFALGLSMAEQKPVALVCTSGTAGLNYSPAIAEAFHRNVPLIVVTADRPAHWINQGESQCINQIGIFRNFVRKEVSLPMGESDDELWFAARQINECLNLATSRLPAPVHINIPFDEPLFQLVDEPLPETKEIGWAETQLQPTAAEYSRLADIVNRSRKILVLAGQLAPNPALEKALEKFSDKTGAVILHEHLSNLSSTRFCSSVDALVAAIEADRPDEFCPDLLISFGGQFVSKSLKQYLRKYKPLKQWYLSSSDEHFDTYRGLDKVIASDVVIFFESIVEQVVISADDEYLNSFKEKETQVNRFRREFSHEVHFSDWKAFEIIAANIPGNTVLHLGNSSAVRYALMHERADRVSYYCNRGVAGIDGCLSTAVGFAHESCTLNTVILGDLSFFYDSNALWNKYVASNLRIIVINNGGGNIFGLINGPDTSTAFENHFLAASQRKAEDIAKIYGLDYFAATDETTTEQGLNWLYSSENKRVALLELFTDSTINAKVFREFNRTIRY